ncbi:MAG TPA: phosphoadenylyl-sulfate reductase [Usitatibacteraceae bacterium]|nr:phosphoadenylyl-sulfate reductase [Usitatibacteraceae bacterium]
MRLEMLLAQVRTTLERIEREFLPASLAVSFGAEDMVLVDLVAREFPAIRLFTLDTGRLPKETLELKRAAEARYGIDIRVFSPKPENVAAYVNAHGENGFYESLEKRKACCHVRKVEPLRRALAGHRAWITGLRRDQAPTRAALAAHEFDSAHGLHKFNPLADWTDADVWAYLRSHDVPVNALHARGYPSIGCEPCTRAVRPGEDPRAGRWWWEERDTKECGLHPVVPLVAAPISRANSEAAQ